LREVLKLREDEGPHRLTALWHLEVRQKNTPLEDVAYTMNEGVSEWVEYILALVVIIIALTILKQSNATTFSLEDDASLKRFDQQQRQRKKSKVKNKNKNKILCI
jgi:hypothetical protein